MNQNIKSFEEFKKIYIQDDFQQKLNEIYKIKKRYRKFIIFMLISVILIYFSLIIPFIGPVVVGIIMAILGYIIFGKQGIKSYSNYFRLEIPKLIAKMSGIELQVKELNEDEYYKEIENIEGSFKKARYYRKTKEQYENDLEKRIKAINQFNASQFKKSKIVKADMYDATNIAKFIHQDTKTRFDLYTASAYKVKEIDYIDDQGFHDTRTKEKLLNYGLVLSVEKLDNIHLNDITVLIKNDDTLISHLTENTIDNLKNDKNEIKFNRIDLNKSFDCLLYGDKRKDYDNMKLETLQILTPTVEDLFAYLRKKFGRYNLAINNNRIDIEFLDMRNISTKNIMVKPKLFSNKDLRISSLYRFYELIEIQKLILKFFKCYPDKYLINEDDIKGLREAIESNKLSEYEMDKSVKSIINF